MNEKEKSVIAKKIDDIENEIKKLESLLKWITSS
jgi:hypothetical protein